MSGTDAASLSDAEVLEAVSTRRKPVPVPPLSPGTGNQFPEPSGTAGTGNQFPEPSGTAGTGNQFPEPSGTAGTGTSLFESLSAFLARTKDLPPLSWLIEGMVPDAGNLLVVSAPGVGKTFLALVIAKKAAEAGRHSLLVLEEGRERSMFDRFSSLAFPPDAPVSIAHRKGVHLEDEKVRTQIAEMLSTHAAPVLVLDPFSSLFHGNENDTEAVNQAKEHVQRLATINPRALVVLLHHTSKAAERGEGPAVYASRGSTVLPGWADVQVNLSREDTPSRSECVAFVVQVAKGRDGGTAQRYRVTISLGTGTVSIEDAREAAAHDKAQEVRKIFGSATAPLSRSEIAKRFPGRRQEAFQIIKAMEERGELKQEGRGLVLVQNTITEDES